MLQDLPIFLKINLYLPLSSCLLVPVQSRGHTSVVYNLYTSHLNRLRAQPRSRLRWLLAGGIKEARHCPYVFAGHR